MGTHEVFWFHFFLNLVGPCSELTQKPDFFNVCLLVHIISRDWPEFCPDCEFKTWGDLDLKLWIFLLRCGHPFPSPKYATEEWLSPKYFMIGLGSISSIMGILVVLNTNTYFEGRQIFQALSFLHVFLKVRSYANKHRSRPKAGAKLVFYEHLLL